MNIIITGVGGQGIIFVSAILAAAVGTENIQYCKIFDEGQRTGSVSCHIRINEPPSPTIPNGAADILIAMDKTEGERNKKYLKDKGVYIYKDENNMFMLGKIYKYLDISNDKIEELLNTKPRSERNIQDFRRGKNEKD